MPGQRAVVGLAGGPVEQRRLAVAMLVEVPPPGATQVE